MTGARTPTRRAGSETKQPKRPAGELMDLLTGCALASGSLFATDAAVHYEAVTRGLALQRPNDLLGLL